MTDRTVRVSLVAQVQGYITGMAQARKATSEMSDEAKKKLEAQRQTMETVGKAALTMGAVAAAGVAIAIKKFADWDAQMSQVQSLSHATAQEMDQLRESSLSAGRSIGFSATQVADAQTELVKAGVSVSDMLNGSLNGALNLAAAGQIEVGKATQIAAVAMTQFHLAGKDVPHLADLLAAGADKALGGVDELGDALNQGGLVASQFGLSIEDTVGTMSAFANAGLLGSDAGTSFKTMLLSLASPSQKAADLMTELGISAYDANGKFVGIVDLAGQLQKQLAGLSSAQRDSALSTIFGTDAIRAANVLYKEGSKGIQGWIKAVDDQGFAADQARGKMNNLNGDLKKLGAAFETNLIKAGSAANGPLRELSQTATGLLSAFGDLPDGVQQTTLVLAAATAAIGVTGGAALIAVPKVINFADSLDRIGNVKMASALTSTASFLTGPWGIALGIGAGVVGGAFLQSVADAQAKVDAFTESLDKNTGSITENTKTAAAKQLKESGAFDIAKRLGIDLGDLTNASIGDPEAIAKVNAQLDEYTKKIGEIQKTQQKKVFDPNSEVSKTSVDVLELNQILGRTQDSLGKSQQDFIDNAKATGELAAATDTYERALSKANSALSQNGASLDQSTSAGQANQTALDALADASAGVVAATAAQGAAQDEINAKYSAAQKQLYAVAAQFGLTGAAADEYVNAHLGKVPAQIATDVILRKQAALEAIGEINAAYSQLQARMNAGQNIIVRPGGPAIAQANGGLLAYFAAGGLTENHVAQIAPAGAMRVWAEPETGGEAYIPLSAAKRARSLAIWQETGKRLGAHMFADGGMPSATSHLNQQVWRSAQPAPTYVPASNYSPTIVVNSEAPSLAGVTLNARIAGFAEPVQIMIDGAIQQNERARTRRARM